MVSLRALCQCEIRKDSFFQWLSDIWILRHTTLNKSRSVLHDVLLLRYFALSHDRQAPITQWRVTISCFELHILLLVNFFEINLIPNCLNILSSIFKLHILCSLSWTSCPFPWPSIPQKTPQLDIITGSCLFKLIKS